MTLRSFPVELLFESLSRLDSIKIKSDLIFSKFSEISLTSVLGGLKTFVSTDWL